jgi:hypothetical protein
MGGGRHQRGSVNGAMERWGHYWGISHGLCGGGSAHESSNFLRLW